MKKSSFIFLTILASLSLEVCSAQDAAPKAVTPVDTVIVDDSDSVYYYHPQPTVYNYYYRSRIWNSFYRICFPRRYYATINRPGYIPRHLRHHQRWDVAHHTGKTSHKRGGFGRSGSRTIAG